jgi:hypothetical protein
LTRPLYCQDDKSLRPTTKRIIQSLSALCTIPRYGSGTFFAQARFRFKPHPSTLAEVSKKHDWQERIAAFDACIEKASQHNQAAQVRATKRRQITLALRAQKVAEKGLKNFFAIWMMIMRCVNYYPKVYQRSSILDIGCRLERLNHDEPEQNVKLVQQANYDRLTIEEIETLRNLHAKAEGR